MFDEVGIFVVLPASSLTKIFTFLFQSAAKEKEFTDINENKMIKEIIFFILTNYLCYK
jgi:hypothetical protein